MRVTDKKLRERLEYLNSYILNICTMNKNIFYSIREINGSYYLDQNNNCIYVGSKREVFEHLHTIFNVIRCLDEER